MPRIAVVVHGMHRSGTSAVARAINLLGYRTARHLMPPQPDNPNGFWEPLDIVELNDRLLAQLDRRWDDPRPIPPNALGQAVLTPIFDEATTLITDEFGADDDAFTMKDPRVSRLWPFWSRVLAAADIQACCIHVVRNPIEVALSLAARNGLGPEQATLLWAAHVLEAMQDDGSGPTAPMTILPYEELIEAPARTLARAVEALRLPPPSSEALAEAAASIAPEDRHHRLGIDAVLQNPALSELVKRLYLELRLATHSAAPPHSSPTLRQLHSRWLDAWNIMSPLLAPIGFPTVTASTIRRPEAEAESPPPTIGQTDSPEPQLENQSISQETGADAPAASPSGPQPVRNTPERHSLTSRRVEGWDDATTRKVIVHYHLFKNAGTSLDDAFKQAVAEQWIAVEAETGALTSERLATLIEEHPEHTVFSSHTALFPVPVLAGCAVFPIIFVRHPIDRVRSVYRFERKQNAMTAGAIAAKQMDFPQYVAWRLERQGDYQFRNFQTARCSAVPARSANLDTAISLLSTLPFVGLVEAFEKSITVLNEALQMGLPGIELKVRHSNRTQEQSQSLEERVENIKQELGSDLFARLVAANQDDLALFEIVRYRYLHDTSLENCGLQS